VRRLGVACLTLIPLACGSEAPSTPLQLDASLPPAGDAGPGPNNDAGPDDAGLDAGSSACAEEGQASPPFELVPSAGQASGTFDGVAIGTISGEDLTFVFESGARVRLRIAGPAATDFPREQRLQAHVEVQTAGAPSVHLTLRFVDGVNAGVLRYAVWDTTGALPDVQPYTLRYEALTCGVSTTACETSAAQRLVVGYDTLSVPLSPEHQSMVATAYVANGTSHHPLETRCADVAPRVRGYLTENYPPVSTACTVYGTSTTFLALTPADVSYDALVYEGVATASITGASTLGVRFEDGRRVELGILGDAALAFPQNQRWRTHIAVRASSFVPYAMIVLRSPDGPEPGALRFAAWQSANTVPDTAPFELSYRAELCDYNTLNTCATTAPQTLRVTKDGASADVSRNHSLEFQGATIANGSSYYVAESFCSDQNPEVRGFIAVP
jgi:hypothetical protein